MNFLKWFLFVILPSIFSSFFSLGKTRIDLIDILLIVGIPVSLIVFTITLILVMRQKKHLEKVQNEFLELQKDNSEKENN